MSAARRCSRSSSTQRYSRSHTRDRHSRSHCCSTAEGHGSWTLYPSAKLVFFCETRLTYGEKREREQPFGSPSVAFFKIFPLYVVRFFRNTTAPLKASRTPWFAFECDPALSAPAYTRPPFAYALLLDRRGTRLLSAVYHCASEYHLFHLLLSVVIRDEMTSA